MLPKLRSPNRHEMVKKNCFLTFFFLSILLLFISTPSKVSASCTEVTQTSCGECNISGNCGSVWQYCTYEGTDSDTFATCSYGQNDLCSGDPNSCAKADSCDCGGSYNNVGGCVTGATCTGSYGDGCHFCQSPICNNNGVQDNGETGVDCGGGGGCGSCAPSSGGGGGGGTTTPPAVTCAAPALTNPTYNCASTSVTLSWSSASGASSYKPRMQRYVNDVATYTPLDSRNNCSPHNVCIDNLNATSLSNVAVNPGSRYNWWVHSTCGSYPSSANSSFTVPSCPSAPTNLTATCAAGGASATLSWSASSGASSYTVRVPTNLGGSGWSPAWGTNATAGDAIYTTSSTSLIFQISPNTNYGWSVQPIAAGETYPYGADQTAAPTGFDCPSCPAGSCQTTTAGCSNYNAFPARACPSGTCQTTTASSYDGISCTGTSACSNYYSIPAGTIPACRTSDGNVADGSCGTTPYSANCSTACNGAGSSCCASLPAAPALAGFSPATGSTLRTAGNTTFSWNEIAGVAGYYFRLSPNGISCSATNDYCPDQITSTSISHTLTAGTDYTWWVHNVIAANGSCGTVGNYTSATLHVCSAMTTPGSLSPSGTINAGTQNITWSSVAGATGYYLRVDDLADGVVCSSTTNDICTGVLSATTTSYSYTFLAGHTYDIWVHSVVDSNPLCYSDERRSAGVAVRAIPPQPTITVTPACINTGNDGSGISIRWTNNSPVTWVDISTSSDFSAYYHKQITGSVAGASGSTNGTGFNLSTGGGAVLTYSPNTTYYVRLFDGQNNSNPTNPANFSIPPCCNNCSSSCTTTTECGTGFLPGTCTADSYSGGGSCFSVDKTCYVENKSCAISGQTCDDATHTCVYSPWIQAEGDVHSNSGINTPGGP